MMRSAINGERRIICPNTTQQMETARNLNFAVPGVIAHESSSQIA